MSIFHTWHPTRARSAAFASAPLLVISRLTSRKLLKIHLSGAVFGTFERRCVSPVKASAVGVPLQTGKALGRLKCISADIHSTLSLDAIAIIFWRGLVGAAADGLRVFSQM